MNRTPKPADLPAANERMAKLEAEVERLRETVEIRFRLLRESEERGAEVQSEIREMVKEECLR